MRWSSSPGSSRLAISGTIRVQHQWAPEGCVGSSVSRFRAMRRWVWTPVFLEGLARPESGVREIPARITIRLTSPGASPSVRAGRPGPDTRDAEWRQPLASPIELEDGHVGIPAGARACTLPDEGPGRLLYPKARGVPSKYRVGLAHMERP